MTSGRLYGAVFAGPGLLACVRLMRWKQQSGLGAVELRSAGCSTSARQCRKRKKDLWLFLHK